MSSVTWYYQILGETFGPISSENLRELIEEGDLASSDSVSVDGVHWQAAAEVLDLLPALDEPGVDDELQSLLENVTGDSHGEVRTTPEEWFCRVLGEELGPFQFPDLVRMTTTGELSADDEIRGPRQDWIRAGDVEGLFSLEEATTSETVTSDAWFVELEGGGEAGPMPLSLVRGLVAGGSVQTSTRVREGSGPWVRAATVPGLFDELIQARSATGMARQAVRDSSSPASPTPPPQKEEASSNPEKETVATTASMADTWSDFFAKAEQGDESPPAGSSGTVAGSASAGATAPREVVPPPAPPRAVVPPRSTPSTPVMLPPRPRRRMSISLPSFNVSGWMSGLGSTTEMMNGKTVGALLVVAAVVVYLFVPLSPTDSSAEQFEPIAAVFDRARQLHESEADASQWDSLREEALPLLDQAQSQVAPLVKERGSKAPLAQRILWLVDVPDGPSSSDGLLRQMLKAGPNVNERVIEQTQAYVQEASYYLRKS